MSNNTSENLMLEERLREAGTKLGRAPLEEQDLHAVAAELSNIADVASQGSLFGPARGAEVLSRLSELAGCWCSQFQDDPGLVEELVAFITSNLPVLESAISCSDDDGTVDEFVQLAEANWNDYLALLDGNSFQAEPWGDAESESDEPPLDASQGDEEPNVPNSQIALMLSAINDTEDGSTGSAIFEEPGDSPRNAAAPVDQMSAASDEAAKLELVNDREMLEAYLDDALRCLSSMEQSAMAFEDAPDDREPVEQFCRELHTLKGASATVGLSQLASYLHELETSLQTMFAAGSQEVEAEPLFEAVDRVRAEIGALQQHDAPVADLSVAHEPESPVDGGPVVAPSAPAKVKTGFASFAVNDDSSIRIRAAKLDRLMDMLAELVVLRNRRESHVAEFNVFNEELARCASRLNFAEEQSKFDAESEPSNINPFVRNSSCTFSEVAKDITALSHGMRELQKPVSQDNNAISRFIRDFRQELMQLRRVPVSGLFNRLQRAARDAAKSENKQVQIQIVGEHAGLEQEIQERLFESLLHVVRNSVSHGIEAEAKRVKAGKTPVGTVWLEASSSAQLLIIEVRDDGNGLDYEAVRRRAIQKGLLSSDHQPTNDEVAKLIFLPGFSTREQASEVSGRGVGMDIVAKTIEQLHGRIEVDSVAGQGTTMRLLIPLRTGIEHVMVFRSDGQLFALPMQSVTAAKSSNTNIGNIAKLSLSSSLSRSNQSNTEDVLILRRANNQVNCSTSDREAHAKTEIALAVDVLVGPEEVVVRGLPNLLKRHPLFCGVTLSGSGEKVLLLDSERVSDFCHQQNPNGSMENENEFSSTEGSNRKRVLVVDDSLTARKSLVKILGQHGIATVEAGDGIEAIERLHKEQFDLVLTDLDMPRFGGLELLSDIQSSRYCDAPVVVVSSRNEEAFRTKAMDVGAADYLTKPVSEMSITQLLESLELLPKT